MDKKTGIGKSSTSWFCEANQWKAIPVAFVIVGLELFLAGINVAKTPDFAFGISFLVVGLFTMAVGVMLLYLPTET